MKSLYNYSIIFFFLLDCDSTVIDIYKSFQFPILLGVQSMTHFSGHAFSYRGLPFLSPYTLLKYTGK